MRIAILNHQRLRLPSGGGPPSSGSIGHYCYEMAVRLADQLEVIVVSPKGGRFRARETEHRGVRFVEIPTGLDESIESGAETLKRIVGRSGNPRRPLFAARHHFGLYGARAAREVRRRGCDLVQIVNRSQFVPAVRAKNPRARIHLHMQCEWLTQLDPKLVAGRVAECDLLSACSSFVIDRVATDFPESCARCFTLHNGVDADRFHPRAADASEPASGPRIVFAGRVSPEKGLHHLVEAFETVFDHHANARLELIGPPNSAPYELVAGMAHDTLTRELSRYYDPGTGYIEQLLSSVRPEVRERIELVGNVEQEQLASRLRGADLFVHPSVWCEPFGMAILEAMASGVSVIATTSGGIPEFVTHGRTGWLVPRGSTSELGTAMVELLSDPAQRHEIAARARADVLERWTWQHAADRLLERISELPA